MPVADATDAPVVIWDRSIWDFVEGEDFEPGEWRFLACELRAIAAMLGGHGSAVEIVRRSKDLSVNETVYRWRYIALGPDAWRGIL
jgi:hypothetical protein